MRIRNTIVGILAIHVSIAASCAQETAPQPGAQDSIHAKVDSLSKELEAKEKSLVSARSESNDPLKRRSLAEQQLRLDVEYAKKFLAVADLVPGQSLALEPLYAAAVAEDRGPEVEIALQRMRSDCASDPKIGELCRQLGYLPSAKVEPLLREILVKNADRTAKGHACLALARLLAFRAELPRYRAQDPEMAKGLERHYDKSMLDELDRRDVKAMVAEAETLYERVLSEFADVKLVPSNPKVHRTIRPEAETWLAARRELAIGKLAPEIVGTDVDGKPLKLSDYRGKVVVLVFWASWCGPCMEQVPHEVALAKRLAGKPFTILGVNLDRTLADARAVIEKERIPWPNFCDGDPTKPGPIFTLYHIQSVPVIYVLDKKGIIRAKDVHGDALHKCAEMLLGESQK